MKKAIAALLAYGYVLNKLSDLGDRYIRPGKRSQEWLPTEGGFRRFDPDGPVPYKITTNAPGLDFNNPAHHDHFEWVWPDAEVARIYGG